MLVTLTGGEVDPARLQPDADDLRFALPDGTLLDFEVQAFDPDGATIVWVRLPTFVQVGTRFFAYYGNAAAAPGDDPAGVWSAGYVAVWHLEEEDGTRFDSTGRHDAEPTSGTVDVAPGRIGAASVFDHTGLESDILSAPDHADFSLAGVFTVEAWILPSSLPAEVSRVVHQTTGASSTWGLATHGAQASLLTQGAPATEWRSAAVLGTTAWVWVAGAFLNGGSDDVAIYVDGHVSVGEPRASSNTADGGDVQLGGVGGRVDRRFFGAIDEVRVSNVRRGADWIRCQYESMTGALLTFGAEEPQNPAPP